MDPWLSFTDAKNQCWSLTGFSSIPTEKTSWSTETYKPVQETDKYFL